YALTSRDFTETMGFRNLGLYLYVYLFYYVYCVPCTANQKPVCHFTCGLLTFTEARRDRTTAHRAAGHRTDPVRRFFSTRKNRRLRVDSPSHHPGQIIN